MSVFDNGFIKLTIGQRALLFTSGRTVLTSAVFKFLRLEIYFIDALRVN